MEGLEFRQPTLGIVFMIKFKSVLYVCYVPRALTLPGISVYLICHLPREAFPDLPTSKKKKRCLALLGHHWTLFLLLLRDVHSDLVEKHTGLS